jgi:UDP-N-acetylmuramate dehydrogenase
VTSLADGIAATRRREELRYGYRFLTLAPAEIILAASFQLVREEPGEIAVRLERNLAYRRQAQRITLPNAGSFFRNPPGEQAWRLIDAAGLRGHRIGGAQVSEVHSNFLVNLGDATARDFLELAELIKTRVRETSGILLETEVRIVGEE